MLKNFYKRLNILGGETIWPVNPTRNFLKNLKKNVPRNCTVFFDYKEEPVDIIIYWFRAKKKENYKEIFEDLKSKYTKALWFVISKAPSNLSRERLRDFAAQNGMMQNKTADFTKDEYGLCFVFR
ncbi:hypothetical protein A2526_02095 [candidate division WOR-1 bacterium RIFOXYD2_FULL_36_8]|uniref:Uncharacterized protein n=1 Tax=candidate division WOR-1 bacterium RIFOXYB2_FULL_36_35 TaxID=1802578 RepID=A0A1F4S000_UNCSA|nr:MAG: hypothetical protein A2230_00175 [candidate division WOR-1 bacterium RIFOXYA2_FULL_36_21]OGC13752.1 MAG: hypothetical protein A2290_07755 [candidate division WOR-1 bacterium RIFOXYB2_FULL_36_35]OGC14475.1 MAG: hypothetical protein A2282_08755 [candidate division WOR-1 bacterium RIFOXYA12_FULL_36_13]OGC41329.1 MAG: hypothetical protein A2526_02095 [candidate division WOR-1 bacterium RIFOXYD2_FULL_36_8]